MFLFADEPFGLEGEYGAVGLEGSDHGADHSDRALRAWTWYRGVQTCMHLMLASNESTGSCLAGRIGRASGGILCLNGSNEPDAWATVNFFTAICIRQMEARGGLAGFLHDMLVRDIDRAGWPGDNIPNTNHCHDGRRKCMDGRLLHDRGGMRSC